MLGLCCLESSTTCAAGAGDGSFFPKSFLNSVENIVDIDLVLLPCPPFTNDFFVPLSLQMVASIAQRLKVAAIEESLNATDRPRDYMVDAGSCRDDAGPLTLLTELIPRGVPEGL